MSESSVRLLLRNDLDLKAFKKEKIHGETMVLKGKRA